MRLRLPHRTLPMPRSTRISRTSLLLLGGLLVLLTLAPGCTRRFFRLRADEDVARILAEKADPENWPLINYYVYPNPLARFADLSGKPDHPPMPPDDAAAWLMNPRPQRPKEVVDLGGDGWLEMLRAYDAENRAKDPRKDPATAKAAPGSEGPRIAPNRWGREEPFRINLLQSLELAIINSREFQSRREDLYLAALPVTLQRFNFYPQFLATQNAIRSWATSAHPNGPQDAGLVNSNVGVSQAFATGALLLLRTANQTVIDFSDRNGPTLSQTAFLLDLTQPLLQGAGKAVALENLTQAERNLLYAVREYARFGKEFFAAIAVGGRIVTGSGIGAFGGANLNIRGQAAIVGYYPTLEIQARLENQRANVAALEGYFNLIKGLAEGGGYSKLQVDQVELDLLQARSQVLALEVSLADSLDQFKIQLGIPTDVPLELEPEPLQPIRAQIDRFDAVDNQFRKLLNDVADLLGNPANHGALRTKLVTLIENSPLTANTKFQKVLMERWHAWATLDPWPILGPQMVLDFARMLGRAPTAVPPPVPAGAVLPRSAAMRFQLEALQARRTKLQEDQDRLERTEQPIPQEILAELQRLTFELDVGFLEFYLTAFEDLVDQDAARIERSRGTRDELLRRIENFVALVIENGRAERAEELQGVWPKLPPVLLNGQDLLAMSLEDAQNLAGQVALANRLDLMNQRAQLADSWRKIAVAANSLLGTFDVRYNMEVLTPPTQVAQPLNFDGMRARHQLIVNTELPLVRRLERNVYRASLIAFQRQRRNLMATEDNILFQVRQAMRRLRQLTEVYKIQQRALEVAYSQVDNSAEQLRAPADPGVQRDAATSAATFTQQLLNAQSRLPNAQNNLFSTWVNFIQFRMELYRDLELMRLDSRGVWIDDLQPLPDRPRIGELPNGGGGIQP